MMSSENDIDKIKELDAGLANKFRFEWLEAKVTIIYDKVEETATVGDSIIKIQLPGQVQCKLCCKVINYGGRGLIAIKEHIKSAKHVKLHFQKKNNHKVDTLFRQYSSEPEPPSLVSKLGDGPRASVSSAPAEPMIVPMYDRVSNSEAMLLGFLAENSLPFTMAPKLIDLTKGLAKDQKALSHLSKDRTSASYKMKFGMGKTYFDRTVSNMKKYKFSLNMDESTSTNLYKVLTVLVSYYQPETSSVVVEHLTSLDLITVNAESITNHIVNLFTSNEIPWCNLTSVLMDSCNVMRGSKSGVEQRLRKYAPHLLDIDGDTCHHVHNASKKLCNPFDYWVEQLFNDLHNDVKWSTDIRDLMKEVATLMNLKFTMPEQFVSHRWLSCYDVAVNTKRMMDVYRVIYFSFMSKENKVLYRDVINDIMEKKAIGELSQSRIEAIQNELSKKNLTSDGRNRKLRIVEKLFERHTKTELIINFYTAVLPMLKAYVVLFESKEPMIHKLIEKQEILMSKFLACIVQPDAVLNKSGKQLKRLDLSETSTIFLKERDMFVGAANRKMMRSLPGKDVNIQEFLKCAAAGYIVCANYLLKKLPLDNDVLRAASAIDPEVRSQTYTARLLNSLPDKVENVLNSEEEEEKFAVEVKDYQVDKSLPPHQDVRIDRWWADVSLMNKYPTLCKMVFALLSCFHGPQVESSFNVMGDILNSRTGRMKIGTYSAIQSTKYALGNFGVGVVKNFARQDPVKAPVDKVLGRNLRSAAAKYKKDQEVKRAAQDETTRKLSLKTKLETKTANKKLQAAAAESEKENHEERMINKRRKEMLTALAAKKKKLA